MIDDGYTQTLILKPDGWKPHCIEYRPLLVRERNALFQQLLSVPGDAALRLLSHRIKRQLVFADGLSTEAIRKLYTGSPGEFDRLRRTVCSEGEKAEDRERDDANNLALGVGLLHRYPSVARTTCEFCQKWWYNPWTGKVHTRQNHPQHRPADTPPACRTREGCPKGAPEFPRTLSAKNQAAWRHYRECLAVGRFPDDAIVRHNAVLIRDVLAEVEDERRPAASGARRPARA